MSVLKAHRSESKAEFINTANQIYVQTINFLSRLSSRYSRLMATQVANLATEVLDHAEKANNIYPSDATRKELRKTHLLEARASLMALDVHLAHCYELMMTNPAGHYMDDYYIIVPPGKDPKEILRLITAKATSLRLTISASKTKIIPLTKPFRYCKAKYTLTDTGKVIVNGNRDSVNRARRKIKAFYHKVNCGEMTYEDLWTSVNGMLAYFACYNDHGRILRLRRLFYAIFGFSPERIENFREGGNKGNEICCA